MLDRERSKRGERSSSGRRSFSRHVDLYDRIRGPPAEGGGKGGDGGDEGGAGGARRERREPSSEDHWSVVLKKLAPQGYQKAPQWQQEIIEKVVKGMASRQKDTRGVKQSGLSKEQMARTIDLSALCARAREDGTSAEPIQQQWRPPLSKRKIDRSCHVGTTTV